MVNNNQQSKIVSLRNNKGETIAQYTDTLLAIESLKITYCKIGGLEVLTKNGHIRMTNGDVYYLRNDLPSLGDVQDRADHL